MVLAKRGKKTIRAPVLLGRAKRHELHIEWKDVPEGMILIPGGPFLAPDSTRLARMKPYDLPDFAIGEFPVTLREYARFLDALSPEERLRRSPHVRNQPPWLTKQRGQWVIADDVIEGDGKKRVPRGRELDLPVMDVNWFDALAYAKWLSRETGVEYRLPTSLEWDKAARGVDGRPFPMALRFDPALAKLRESRPEASQPEPVGAFPSDVSPYGVRDLLGGVHDWTASTVSGVPAPNAEEESSPETQGEQANVRGGSWTNVYMEPLIVRGAYRVIDRAGWVGFRLKLDVSAPASSIATTTLTR